jgi:hypothetical protein
MQRGSRFVLTADAVENYGEEHRGVVYEVTDVYREYGRGPGQHLGYDGTNREGLYEFKRVSDGEPMQFAVYSWEMRRVGGF